MTSRPVILSGIKPTNRLTLGNYLGAIKNWVQLQNQYHCYFMAVDLHSITVRQSPAELRENTLFALATYLACGIHPDHATIFIQSQVHAHSQLAWILNCNSYMGELNRMTQFKDKSAKAGSNIPAGLFSYPTLMAADILLYDANLVPVGADQKQHIELTRDLAIRMNGIYGENTFIVPEPFIAKVGARIMDLQEPQSKMGKSDSSESGAIFISDTAKAIEKKFKRAVTDSGTEITYESEKAGVKNLLDIQSAITGRPPPELVASYQGKMYGHLKLDTAAMVADELTPIQDKISRYLDDRGELMKILKIGRDRAAEQADKTIRRIHERIGFVIS
jgi:tryptophanyl-tRNA synthetase